jgi:non-ribosomal peptide synthase protein (TIGR01720 family)
VVVSHASLRQTIGVVASWLERGDVVPAIAAIGFDISLVEMLTPLVVGGTTAIWTREQTLDLPWVSEALRHITVLHAVPTLMTRIVEQVRQTATVASSTAANPSRPTDSTANNPQLDRATSDTPFTTTTAVAASDGAPRRAQTLRLALVGGEAVPGALVTAMQSVWPSATVRVLYGPTEGTMVSCAQEMARGAWEPTPSVGRPLPNTQAYVLDVAQRPVPAGVVGELYVGGPQVARGYLGQPALTAMRFVPDPFSAIPGGRLYRTGDLAQWRRDGTLTFAGRADQQVKVRGYRIELEEIDAVLRQHPAVADAVTTVRELSGHPQLIAYVVPRAHDASLHTIASASPSSTQTVDPNAPSIDAIERAAIRAWLRERLPGYMVPAQVVTLPAVPLTVHGKVDRTALPAPPIEATDASTAPQTALEGTLAAIWAEVLGRPAVGLTENFFELGGDSILSLQVVSRARQRGVAVTARQVFEHPTIAELAVVVAVAQTAGGEQGLVSGEVALTPVQQQFFAQAYADPHHWNQAVLLAIPSGVAVAGVRATLTAIVAHHDALRMRYEPSAQGWRQVNLAEDPAAWWSETTLTDPSELNAEVERVQASLDLTSGPVQHARYLALPDGTARLLWVIHHLVVDGVSWRVLLEDLATGYAQWSRGEAIRFPAKSASLRQWSAALTTYARSEELATRELAYWTAQAADLPPVPIDGHGANTVGDATRATVSLDEDETTTLVNDLATTLHVTVHEVLLATAAQAYGAWSGQSELVVALEGHGREETLLDLDVARTVGWFTSVYPVRVPTRATSTAALVATIKERLRAVPNHGIGYGVLRDLAHAPALAGTNAAVSFNYLGQWDTVLPRETVFGFAAESAGTMCSARNHRTHVLDLTAAVGDRRLHLGCTYSRGLHDAATIDAFVDAWTSALRALVADLGHGSATIYAPSDFPLAGIGQDELAAAVAELTLDE